MNKNYFIGDELFLSIYELLNNTIKSLEEYINDFIEINSKYGNIFSSNDKKDDKSEINEYLFIKKYVNRLLHKIEHALEKEFRDCISLIQIDDKIHNKLIHGFISIDSIDSIVNNVNPTTLLKHILEIMVTDYIITKKVDETKLSILYKNLKDFFYNEDIDFITLAPLHDFDSDGLEPIPISSSLTIRKIGLEEKIV